MNANDTNQEYISVYSHNSYAFVYWNRSKLFQEPDIISVQQADVVEFCSRFHHGDAFNTPAERESVPSVRVDAAVFQNDGMHHARAAEFKPPAFT